MLEINKENLYRQINENETLFEFIRNTELEFELGYKDLDNITDENLKLYVDFLDDLWCK